MSRETSNNNGGCKEDSQPMRKYSYTQELINNLPYIAMTVLGAAVFVVGFERLAWRWMAAGAYLTYSVAGALWIMIFVCPYCGYWNTRACPCGYGRVAAKLREKKANGCFTEKFKKHIPVIVPLWFIPLLAGVALAIRNFSWLLLVLIVIFVLDAFVVLPLFSTKHGCKDCPQRDLCPWMKHKDVPH